MKKILILCSFWNDKKRRVIWFLIINTFYIPFLFQDGEFSLCSTQTSQDAVSRHINTPASARNQDIGLCQIDSNSNKVNKWIIMFMAIKPFNFQIYIWYCQMRCQKKIFESKYLTWKILINLLNSGHFNGKRKWHLGIRKGVSKIIMIESF